MSSTQTGLVRTDSEYTVADQRKMAAATNYFRWQERLVRRHLGSRVLEVGCGVGNFTSLLLDRALVVGVDIDEQCIAVHRQRFRHVGWVKSLHTDVLAAPTTDLARYRLDSALFLNVLEHIQDDVTALQRLARVLPAGANIVVLVPAFQALYGPIDERLGHYRRYTRTSLAATAHRAGLSCVTARYVNSIGCLGWWANAKVLRRTEQSEAQIKLFDRWIVPPMSRLEQIVHPPVGQSVLAVLRQR